MKTQLYMVTFFLCGCIGTDIIDDPIVPQILTIDQDLVTLLVGQKEQLSTSYLNQYGISEKITPSWVIANTQVAGINSSGEITALSSGQTTVTAIYEGVMSQEVFINIALSESEVIKVIIEEPAKTQIEIGETLQLNASALNINNASIDNVSVMWTVSNDAVATISQAGLLEGKSVGMVEVTATIEGVKSNAMSFSIGTLIRMGTFLGSNGYTAVGTAQLSKNANEEIILTFSSDFQTSFALGTFIYLSNSTLGTDTKASGLDLGQITTNGAKTFNVTSFKPDVTLNTYRYAIVLCKPASITFGAADFN